MAIEKSLYAAPQGLESMIQPDVEIEIEDPEAVKVNVDGLEIGFEKEADEAGGVHDARELGEDHAQVLGAVRHGLAGELLDGHRVGPVGGHRAEVV